MNKQWALPWLSEAKNVPFRNGDYADSFTKLLSSLSDIFFHVQKYSSKLNFFYTFLNDRLMFTFNWKVSCVD